jgi:hypothetical protein
MKPAALPRLAMIAPGARAERTLYPGLKSYFFLAFLAFFAFFAFFAFLAIASSQCLWMETPHEACSAEGQPRNILNMIPTDSGRAAPRCHACVIALSTDVMLFGHIFPWRDALQADFRSADVDRASSGLTMLQGNRPSRADH